MRRIQEVALDLFDERGYANVSVEEIAAPPRSRRARCTATSAPRNNVLYDEVDMRFVEPGRAWSSPTHPPVDGGATGGGRRHRRVFERDDELVRRKVRYAFEEPALRAASLEMTDAFVPLVADAAGRAAGRGRRARGPGDRRDARGRAHRRRAPLVQHRDRTPLAQGDRPGARRRRARSAPRTGASPRRRCRKAERGAS